MNITLIWLLLIPVMGSVAFVLKHQHQGGLLVSGIALLVSFLVVMGAFYGSVGAQTSAVEIINGKVISKLREQGSYEESYQCNCRTVTSGSGKNQTTSTQCSTCYRTHYTVDWTANTTVGRYRMFNEDSLSPSVYATPDPNRWVQVQPGQPVSATHGYTNYVQAVPNSLFTPNHAVQGQWAGKIPQYPNEVYDFWYCNHLVQANIVLPDAKDWNNDISLLLRDLGPTKQVNLIVAVVKGADPTFADALNDYWNGANKNDVVLVLGTPDGQALSWVRVLSWTKNEMFKVQLRDSLLEIGTLDRAKILATTQQLINTKFERRHMREFKYLESEIDPPTWVLVLTVLFLLGVYGLIFFKFNE